MKGKTNEEDAVQVRREGRRGKNSGNRAELINQILARTTRKQEGRQNTGKEQTTAQNQKTPTHTHTHNEKVKSHAMTLATLICHIAKPNCSMEL